MRQQLRLRVLLPVAVLGLLGAGFGAFAVGQGGDSLGGDSLGSSLPEPGGTQPAATTEEPEEEAPPEVVGSVEPGLWARQANALCTDIDGETIARPSNVEQMDALLASGVQAGGRLAVEFARLGWPEGEEAAVLELRESWARKTAVLDEARTAFAARKFQRLLYLAERERSILRARNDVFRRLGAGACVVAVPDVAGSEEPPEEVATAYPLADTEIVRWMLLSHRVVVVVFYTPDVPVDAKSVRAARAAALEQKAGFLAVNVTREKQVSALAQGYEVLLAPTVLVFKRGPTLASRFDHYADQRTVAQAIRNARR